MIRFLKVLLRGLRPISKSLALIQQDLHTLTRIQIMRLRLEHNEMLTDERIAHKPSRDDLTELSWIVKEPEIDRQTGKPKIEAEDNNNEDDIDKYGWSVFK